MAGYTSAASATTQRAALCASPQMPLTPYHCQAGHAPVIAPREQQPRRASIPVVQRFLHSSKPGSHPPQRVSDAETLHRWCSRMGAQHLHHRSEMPLRYQGTVSFCIQETCSSRPISRYSSNGEPLQECSDSQCNTDQKGQTNKSFT